MVSLLMDYSAVSEGTLAQCSLRAQSSFGAHVSVFCNGNFCSPFPSRRKKCNVYDLWVKRDAADDHCKVILIDFLCSKIRGMLRSLMKCAGKATVRGKFSPHALCLGESGAVLGTAGILWHPWSLYFDPCFVTSL